MSRMNPYLDVEFEEEFVIVPSYEPHTSWVLVDEHEVLELQEMHAKRMRVKAVQKKFHTELIKISSMTGKSISELSGAWADMLVEQVKHSGRKVTELSHQLRERILGVIEKKTGPEVLLNPYAYRDVEPCFPPARVI